MRPALRPLAVAVAVLATLTLATPRGLAAQDSDDPCDVLIERLNRELTEQWDDLPALTTTLGNWTSWLRSAFSYYDPDRLESMTTGEIELERKTLERLRDCLPRVAMTFDRLKKRIEELQNAPGVVGSEDRLRRQRLNKIREVEQLHSEVAVALDVILG